MLVTMKEILGPASAGNYAVAAPNLWTELDARAVIDAAQELRAPLILDIAYPESMVPNGQPFRLRLTSITADRKKKCWKPSERVLHP